MRYDTLPPKKGEVYNNSTGEVWEVIQIGHVVGTDNNDRDFVTMIRLHDNQLRTILQSTFNRKFNKEL